MAQTITWNDLIDHEHIYTASSAGTVFSANRATTAAFDYFTNSPVVNDAIYFGFANPRLLAKGVRLFIGTAFAATAVTFVWEYRTASGWVALPSVVDGSSGFTAAGQRDVSWAWPTTAPGNLSVNGIVASWVRCRISAITTPTEGGAQSTQKLTAFSGAITISNSGATTSNWPETLYQASVAGGWGVASKIGSNGYLFDCHIFIGYSTDAAITTITATLNYIESAGMMWFRKSQSKMVLGALISDTYRTSNNGCLFKATKKYTDYYGFSINALITLYSSTVDGNAPFSLEKVYNSICNSGMFLGYVTTIIDGLISQVSRPSFATGSLFDGSSINNVKTIGSTNACRVEFEQFVRGLNSPDSTYVGDGALAPATNYDSVLIDSNVPSWNIKFEDYPTGGRGPCVFRMYSINDTVLDAASAPIEGVKIALYAASGDNAAFVMAGRITNVLGAAGTAFTANTDVWSAGDCVKIGGEDCQIASGTYPNFVVTRAQRGTFQSTHTVSKQVMKLSPPIATNAQGQSGEILVETNNYKWASGKLPGVTTATNYGPFTIKYRKYGYQFAQVAKAISAAIVSSTLLNTNTFIAANETTAGGYTGIAINGTAKTVTITGAHTLQEIYDYSQWWASQSANMVSAEPIATSDGSKFTLAINWSIIIDGVEVDGTGKSLQLSGTGTYSVINGGDFIGTLADTTHTRVKITAPNLIDGTRVQIWNSTLAVEVDNAIVAGGLGYIHIADIPTVDLVDGNEVAMYATYCGGLTAKKELSAKGILTQAGLSFIDTQMDWQEYIDIGIDGSTVTEFADDYPNLQVDINDPDNTTNRQRLIAWWIFNLTTANGIRYFFGGITVEDVSNYRINTGIIDLYLDNVNTTPLKFSDNSRLYKDDGSSIIAATSNSIQMDSGKVYAYTSGSGVTAQDKTDIITGIRTNLAVELARIDANVSSRLAAGDYAAPDNVAVAVAVRSELLAELDLIDAPISSRLAGEDIRLNALDATISSRLPASSYEPTDNNAVAAAVLAAAQSAPIHSNTREVNSIEVTGSGTDLDPWGPV